MEVKEDVYVFRHEYDSRHAEMRQDIESFKKDVLGRIDKLSADVAGDHNNYLEWKGRAQLMLYVIPGLTGIIGFLLGVHF